MQSYNLLFFTPFFFANNTTTLAILTNLSTLCFNLEEICCVYETPRFYLTTAVWFTQISLMYNKNVYDFVSSSQLGQDLRLLCGSGNVLWRSYPSGRWVRANWRVPPGPSPTDWAAHHHRQPLRRPLAAVSRPRRRPRERKTGPVAVGVGMGLGTWWPWWSLNDKPRDLKPTTINIFCSIMI